MSSGGRREMRGREETTRAGREETASRGCPRGRAGTEGAGVVTGRVAEGVLAAPTEGGKVEGGGHGRLGAMPWLLVKEDGMYSVISNFFFFLFFFLLMIFLGKEGGSARPAPLPNCGVQWWGGDTIKVSQKKMEDVEEGSSSRKK